MKELLKKEILKKSIEEKGYALGCYDPKIEELSEENFRKVIQEWSEKEDIHIYLNNTPHIVEVFIVDNEIDFSVLSQEEYNRRYK